MCSSSSSYHRLFLITIRRALGPTAPDTQNKQESHPLSVRLQLLQLFHVFFLGRIRSCCAQNSSMSGPFRSGKATLVGKNHEPSPLPPLANAKPNRPLNFAFGESPAKESSPTGQNGFTGKCVATFMALPSAWQPGMRSPRMDHICRPSVL